MNSIHDHPAYKEGRESCFSKKGEYENSYPIGSIEYNAFERGWSQALKKTADLLFKPSDYSSMQRDRRKCRDESDINIEKEKYLKGKGY
ncbi:hypothetical protein [Stutzerimonas stutzeri]|jgi:hypothetical protein|uniref:hypothetical protein n=1 Tax=Stutzerimonas stutzeri TaxID=316 RepID=UPI00190C60E5|nr:hypothetical protein [Stutzerimonas stutzeri]MBK3806195.1 hypothetical protein [Stutzerimonas stutzeri]MBK3853342.1 hypothetical protein [Stutzerimonas stutzeri]